MLHSRPTARTLEYDRTCCSDLVLQLVALGSVSTHESRQKGKCWEALDSCLFEGTVGDPCVLASRGGFGDVTTKV